MLPNHRLGKRVLGAPGGDLTPGPPAQVAQLELQLGQETVVCSAQVVGKSSVQQPMGSALLPLLGGAGADTQLLPAPEKASPICSHYPQDSQTWGWEAEKGEH